MANFLSDLQHHINTENYLDETAERQAESSRKFEQETLDSDQVTFDDHYDVDDEIVLMMESGDTDNPRFKELVQIRDAYLD